VAAALRVAVAIAFYFGGVYNSAVEAPLPAAVYAALVLSFAALGALLVVASRNDVRAAWLGGVLLLLAVPMTTRFLSQTGFALGSFLARLQPGAFLPAFLFRFVCEFPSRLQARARAAVRLLEPVSAAFGAAAFAINLSIGIWPASSSELGWRRWLATGQSSPSLYWPTLFLLSAAAAVALVVRMLRSAGDDRTRVRIFVGGLALGLMPLFVGIALEQLWPSYEALVHTPGVESWVAVILFGPLALVPFITTYSVIYDRVVDTRLVIRAAIQHALAKYTIAVLTVIPFVALVFYLFEHRTEQLITLMSGARPLILVGAVAAGVLSLRSQRKILNSIDRRFFREAYDAHLLVTTLVNDQLITRSPGQIAASVRAEIDRALHARADLFVLDDAAQLLQDPSGSRPSLDARSLLLALAMADAHPMDIQLRGTALARLPDAERSWIENGGYELVLAIRSREGAAAGLLALTGKRSELPFSLTDRRSIGALAAPLGLAIENERLSRGSDPTSTSPARECGTCSRLYAAGSPRCPCGGTLADAAVPHVLRGVFRFERRVGAGGMGVVYRATDLNLRRQVAIKTLPRLTPHHAAQLTREAQAMASINHTNLAVIYGIESWRGTPFLIEEYMAGGTLADKLRGGPMCVREVLELGRSLAGVIGQLHASDIVHCDIKPSNIGFSQASVMKLLDFGIAHLLRDAATGLSTIPDRTGELSTIVTKRGIIGTPAYMSPEAARGAGPAPSFDLWSLSVVLFEAIAGRRPFLGQDANEVIINVSRGEMTDLLALRSDCPVQVARFFDRALAHDPERRPRNAADLQAQLSTLQLTIT
jgi:hypothetical protein